MSKYNPFHASANNTALAGDETNLISAWNIFKWTYWIGTPLSFIIIGIPVFIISLVYSCILLYKFWNLLREYDPYTTPGRAVGFCFIPLFNFYWYFIAYGKLVSHFNHFVKNTNQNKSLHVTKELAVANGVFFIIMWIPYLDLIFFIPYVIVHFLLMMQLKEVALCIIRYKAQSTQQTNAPESVAKTLLA